MPLSMVPIVWQWQVALGIGAAVLVALFKVDFLSPGWNIAIALLLTAEPRLGLWLSRDDEKFILEFLSRNLLARDRSGNTGANA
jgi:hypothetical protein